MPLISTGNTLFNQAIAINDGTINVCISKYISTTKHISEECLTKQMNHNNATT